MDADVVAAMAKWPNVPAVFGWLHLTARGEWRIRGEPIANAAIREFIGRNYLADAHGRWYFQNGPQRVFVSLELTPWVYRVDAQGRVTTQARATPARLKGAALLDDGRLLLVTELGPGVVDDHDSAWLLRAVTDFSGAPLNERGFERWMEGNDEAFADARRLCLEGSLVPFARLRADELPGRFGYVTAPDSD